METWPYKLIQLANCSARYILIKQRRAAATNWHERITILEKYIYVIFITWNITKTAFKEA